MSIGGMSDPGHRIGGKRVILAKKVPQPGQKNIKFANKSEKGAF